MSRLAARVSIGAAILALIALAALHVLRPDLHPPSHMMSEYAVGAHGWVMTVCFAAFAASSASLFVASAAHVRGLVGRIGLAFLLLAVTGLAMAAIFPMDPASTAREAMSSSGRMHGVSFMIGVPGEILAAMLLTLALRKQTPRWAGLLVAFAVMVWLSLGVMIVAFVVAAPQPGTVPHGFFGIPNRTFMAAYAGWLMVAAWPMAVRPASQSV
jgi:Protein of unknown function (DUF998)